jgi:hypothetical protein
VVKERRGITHLMYFAALLGINCVTDAHSYDVKAIAAAMSASEAQITDIKYHFNLIGRDGSPDTPDSKLYADVVFQTKQPDGYFLYDIRSASSSSGPPTKTASDLLVAFDGTSTIRIDRTRNGWGQFRADILPGFSEQSFNGLDNPNEGVWGNWSPHSKWNKVLSDDPEDFTVSKDFEKTDGIDTLKLTGLAAKQSKTRIVLWIAASRSFLPLHLEVYYPNGRAASRDLKELVQIKKDCWFPERIVEHNIGDKDPYLTYTKDHIDCKSLDSVAYRPEIPPGTHVMDQVSKLIYDTPFPTTRATRTDITEEKLNSYMDRPNSIAKRATATTQP